MPAKQVLFTRGTFEAMPRGQLANQADSRGNNVRNADRPPATRPEGAPLEEAARRIVGVLQTAVADL